MSTSITTPAGNPSHTGAPALPESPPCDLAWALGIFLCLGAATVLCMVATVLGGQPRFAPATGVVGAAVTGVIGVCWWARRRGMTKADVGLRRPAHTLWHLLWEVPLTVILQILAAAGVGSLVFHGESTGSGSRNASTFQDVPFGAFLLTGVAMVVVLPFVEEVIFRRILMGWAVSQWGTVLGIAVSSAVFAVAHINPMLYAPMVVTGLCCAVSYRWHRSLWAPWIVHAVINGLVFAAVVIILTRA